MGAVRPDTKRALDERRELVELVVGRLAGLNGLGIAFVREVARCHELHSNPFCMIKPFLDSGLELHYLFPLHFEFP